MKRQTTWPVRISAVSVAMVLGVLGGLGAFTFGYGDGTAYLQNNPAACANCHVMRDHFDSWVKSSHKNVATCNDCHLPHDFVGKWITKADNGFFHSLAFTTGDFHDPIQIKPRNRQVTQNACLHCHADFVNFILPLQESTHPGKNLGAGSGKLPGELPGKLPGVEMCVHCHKDVGHALRR